MEQKSLKELRQEKGISQRDMALKLGGMSTQNYVCYERGERVKMPQEMQLKVSEILGIDYEYDRVVNMEYK